jgi:hypothetical protein
MKPLFALHDETEVELLNQIGETACRGDDPRLPQLARDAGQVVVVDPRDRALTRRVAEVAPHAEVVELSLPPSVHSLTAMLRRPGDPLDEAAKIAARDALGALVDARGRIMQHASDAPAGRRSAPWPRPMSSAVRIGVVGELLDLVELQTEADVAAIAVDLLTRIGVAVGRGPHFSVSGTRHGANLFCCIVGSTGSGRKGTSAAFPAELLALADPAFASRSMSGMSSGEGLVMAVRDAADTGRADSSGAPITDPGVTDKRLLIAETELARALRAGSRQGSTLLPMLRCAWDGAALQVMTKAAYAATGAHVAIIGHITAAELLPLLSRGEVSGGTANRFLFVASRRQRQLPFGGEIDRVQLGRIASRLARYLDAGRQLGEVPFDAAARAAWPAMYARLVAGEMLPGIGGELLARQVAQVRRLALVYAIACGSAVVAEVHLAAAAEVARYCRDSALHAFGSTTGSKVADRIIGELRGIAPAGLTRDQCRDLFDRHVDAATIGDALALLVDLDAARVERVPTAGRPRSVYYAKGEP